MNSNNLVEVKNLSIAFGNKPPVVNNISFSIEKGKSVALVGESGSGKTLTSLAILNLLPAKAEITGGEILFYAPAGLSQNLLNMREKELQTIRGNQISMVFQ